MSSPCYLLSVTCCLDGGEWGLVAPAVFKTVASARKRRWVGSIPTRLRQQLQSGRMTFLLAFYAFATGAIVGGGKGAAIGAAIGAAGGAGTEVLTKGKQVQVPAETLLSFKLDQDLRLQAVPY